MRISIEDFYEDIIGKAQSGLGLSDAELIAKSGLETAQLEAARRGDFAEDTARALAPILGLDADSLVEAGNRAWYPEAVEMEGLAHFNTPFPIPGYQEMTVNAFLLWDPDSREAIIFDTGGDASGILETVRRKGLSVKLILLTHTHGDHIAALEEVREATGKPPVYVNNREPIKGAVSHEEGEEWEVGKLRVESRLTHGHSPGGTTYVVTGLSRPIAVVGDSLFANSMGGAPGSYEQAMENNRSKILSLPDDTVLCPGHGPLTTVGEEKAHNPFHPEFK